MEINISTNTRKIKSGEYTFCKNLKTFLALLSSPSELPAKIGLGRASNSTEIVTRQFYIEQMEIINIYFHVNQHSVWFIV